MKVDPAVDSIAQLPLAGSGMPRNRYSWKRQYLNADTEMQFCWFHFANKLSIIIISSTTNVIWQLTTDKLYFDTNSWGIISNL